MHDLRRPLYHAAFRRNQSRAYRFGKCGIIDSICNFIAECGFIADLKLHIQNKSLLAHTLFRQFAYDAIDIQSIKLQQHFFSPYPSLKIRTRNKPACTIQVHSLFLPKA